MGKSSSSRRKKRSKLSAKKSRKTSKSRKLKSKKLRHRDDSLSLSDGSSSAFSSSGSENDYRNRRDRSLIRKDGKKRAKRQSYSSEDSPPKKRKRAKKNAHDEVKNKTYAKKKKRRRDSSISSSSSESRSCSTCRSESTKTNESEFDSDRGRSANKLNKKRDLENSKSGKKQRRYRSRSCSPDSSCGQRSEYSVENSKRLRSIIVVQGKENRKISNEERVEEITFGDSAYEEELTLENGRKLEVMSNSRNSELVDGGKHSNVRNEGSETISTGLGTKCPDIERKSEFSADMELILRQRALENLKRFRGGIEKNTKPLVNWTVEIKCDASKFPEDGNKVISQGEDSKLVISTEAIKGINLQKEQCDSARSSQNMRNISDESDGGGRFMQGSSSSAVEENMAQIMNERTEKNSPGNSNERYSAATEPSSYLTIMSGENNTTKLKNDTKEGSQFEQKTMPVMRGGEMVEVSYKVYIPKKAPALSRRQLKR